MTQTGTPEAAVSSIANQYDLGDTSFDQEADGVVTSEPRAAVEKPAATAPATTTPAAPVKPTVKHPKRLIDRAIDLGISDNTIERLDTDALDDLVYDLNKKQIEESRSVSRQNHVAMQTERRAPNGPGVQDAQNRGTEAPPVTPAPVDEDYDFGEDAALLDDEAKKFWGKHLGRMSKELKETKAKLIERDQLDVQRQKESTNHFIDRLFTQLGPQFEVHFGKGTQRTIPHGSAEYHRRLAVLGVVDKMDDEVPLAQKFERAVKMLYGSVSAPESESEEDTTLEHAVSGRVVPPRSSNGQFESQTTEQRKQAWNGRGAARPTQRKVEEPKGESKAIRTAAKIMRERGLNDDDDDVLDGFPA